MLWHCQSDELFEVFLTEILQLVHDEVADRLRKRLIVFSRDFLLNEFEEVRCVTNGQGDGSMSVISK
jgi:hypothetical protein